MNKIPLVLIVDDDEDDQFLLSMVIKQGGLACELHFAQNGERALEILTQLPVLPDFILTDLNMPRMDGMELLRQIKACPDWHFIPVIMLSTSNSEEMIQRAYRYGVTRFICKPPSVEALAHIWDQLYTHQMSFS